MAFDESRFGSASYHEGKQPPHIYEKDWPGTLDVVDQAEGEFAYRLQQLGFDETDISNLSLGFREIFINAIVHGNQSDRAKTVHVKITVTPAELVVTIRDQGTGFIPAEIPSPLGEERLVKKSGRGLFLAQNFFGEMINQPVEGGHEIILIKKRDETNAKS